VGIDLHCNSDPIVLMSAAKGKELGGDEAGIVTGKEKIKSRGDVKTAKCPSWEDRQHQLVAGQSQQGERTRKKAKKETLHVVEGEEVVFGYLIIHVHHSLLSN